MFYNESISALLFALKSGLEFSFLNGTYTLPVNVQLFSFYDIQKFPLKGLEEKKTC
jgi:hypothetical protein